MNPLYLNRARLACFDNDNGAFIPELWANEGLAILQENMVVANLVHRDFENEIRQYGDVVHTRRPGSFQIRRKTDSTVMTSQDAKATGVNVPLDQWFTAMFTIKDGEASKSFQDLVDIYLRPGMITIARSVDRAVLGRCHAFLSQAVGVAYPLPASPRNRVGRLGALSAANSKDYVLEARETLNVNKAPMEGRNLVLAPVSETALLKNELFIAANKRGDFGSALESAQLGAILGFDTFMDQNVNAVSLTNTDFVQGHVTNALAAFQTVASQTVLISGYEAVNGEFCVVEGNDQPTYLTGSTASTDTTAVTLNEPNKYATAAGAVVTLYKSCVVHTGDTYVKGWAEGIVLTGWTNAPAVGQLIAFITGGTRHTYTIIESYLSAGGQQTVILDRPLDAQVLGDDAAFPGPAGALNLAFHRNALALVTRPLAVPNNAMGVLSHVGVYNDIAMRVSMQYSITAGGTVVNLDILAGVAVLDERLAVVLQG